MAQQTINVGASANDGTGSPLRTAFQFTNSNFNELYAALGGGTGLPGSSGQVLYNNGTAIAGDAGMTYNPTTDTMSLVNLVLSGTFAARNGDTPSAIRAAASDYAAVTFDGATTATRIVSGCQAIGTGDFSLWSRFRVPTSFANNPGVLWLTDTNTGTFRANAMGIYLESTQLRVFRYGTTPATDSRIANVAGFLTNFVGQVVDVVVTRAGNTLKVYINGTDTAYTESTSGTAPAWGQTVVSDFAFIGAQSSTTIFSGRIYRSVVFNRALSASDVTELITTGVNPADQWGTQTQIVNTTTLNGGFETAGGGGADAFANWVESTTGTTTITRDTTVFSPNLSSTASANFTTDASNSSAAIGLSNTLLASKRFRLSFDFRHNGTAAAGPQYNLGAGSDIVGTAAAPNTWTSYVTEAIAGGTTFAFSRASGVGATKTSWYDNTIIERIGAIVDLDFTIGTGYQATDRSTNALHGTLFNGVEFTQPKRVAVVYGTTAASGNTQLLGSLAIPTNAIIEDVIVNSTGSATVSVGNVSAGTQIVNGASVVSGRQKLTIATPFSTTGNLWVNSSAAVTLQFTILYTIAA